MLKIIGKIFQLILIPLVLAGVFFVWSLPRITTDYNFNTDELIYLTRSNYWTAFKTGDFKSPIWSQWGGYDQPQLTNYIYAAIPGDRSLIDPINSPCSDSTSSSFYKTWDCLAGPPINTWSPNLTPIKNMVVSARTLALGISSFAIATTYYLGFMVAGPLAGILAALYLGWYSFFKSLSTMAMMDQILLTFLNLQFILTLLITRSKKSNLAYTIILGLVTGLAFSTKFSAALPTAITYGYLAIKSLKAKRIKLSHLFFSTIFAVAIFLSLHPNLWSHPIAGVTKMLTWRATQLASQNPVNALYTISDRLRYTLKEVATSPFILPITVVSLFLLVFAHQPFAIISLLNLVIFVLILPTSWNRYLLPIMPTIAIYLGSFPSLLYKSTRKLINLVRNNFSFLKQFGLGALIGLIVISLFLLLPITNYLSFAIITISFLLIVQGFLVTRSMLYGFSNRTKAIISNRAAKYSFSIIVPARDESTVIGHTITSLSKLNYPKDLYEILVMIRADDYSTIQAATQAIEECNSENIRIIQVDGDAHNKSYSLNIGLHVAKYDIIGIFDAEDEPNTEILARINDYFCGHPQVGAVQAPVHLVNLNSTWYSSLSAIEYYYWFASVLPYLATKNIVPLGGNTIFTKKEIYHKLGYYDETCLTEDADLGIRLAANNIQVGVVEDVSVATREESPSSEVEVIRQRARWDQGYLQVLDKSIWTILSPKQKIYAVYTLTQPIFRHLSFLNMITTPMLATFGIIPIWVVLVSFVPAYFLLLQLGLYILGLIELSRLYRVKVSIWGYVRTILAFTPYQALLTLATIRAFGKILSGNYSWDKTSHTNSHRQSLAILE